MQYFILVLIGCLIAFLFSLYAFCRDDFILFRKNIEMEKIFNLAFSVAFIGLFFARLFFVVLNFAPLYLNPLAFLLFPYFPGLSLPGGILGGCLALVFFLQEKKYPEGRIFDLFIVSFLAALFFGELIMLGSTYVATKKLSYVFLAQAGISFVLYLLSIRASKQHTLKEGSSGILFIILLSLLFIPTFFIEQPWNWIRLAKEIGPWVGTLIIATVFLFRQDSLSLLVKIIRGK